MAAERTYVPIFAGDYFQFAIERGVLPDAVDQLREFTEESDGDKVLSWLNTALVGLGNQLAELKEITDAGMMDLVDECLGDGKRVRIGDLLGRDQIADFLRWREEVDGLVDGDDATQLYLNQQGREPLLTEQEEVELAQAIERGIKAKGELASGVGLTPKRQAELEAAVKEGEEARDHLARANTKLVVSIAKKYMGRRLPFLDLIQEGNVGLMQAVDTYDYRKGRFSTWATFSIRKLITRALAEKTRIISLSLHMSERIRLMNKTKRMLEQNLGRKPTVEEVARAMDLPAEKVEAAIKSSQDAIALDEPVGKDGKRVGDFIEDKGPGTEEEAAVHLLNETIEELLGKLTSRQAQVVRLRYGIGGREEHIFDLIGKKFGLTGQGIRHINKKALKRLRKLGSQHHLEDYL